MAKRGQRSKYDTHVLPRLKEIEEMSRDYTNQDIAKMCGVAAQTFSGYVTKYKELDEALKRGRTELVKELRSAMIKKAIGFNYTEKKIIKKKNDEGVLEVVTEEIYEKYAQSDVAALNLLLKNYDPKNWANDPQALEIRKKELKLAEKKAENANW